VVQFIQKSDLKKKIKTASDEFQKIEFLENQSCPEFYVSFKQTFWH